MRHGGALAEPDLARAARAKSVAADGFFEGTKAWVTFNNFTVLGICFVVFVFSFLAFVHFYWGSAKNKVFGYHSQE